MNRFRGLFILIGLGMLFHVMPGFAACQKPRSKTTAPRQASSTELSSVEQRADLKSLELTATLAAKGFSDPVSFDVPAEAASMLIELYSDGKVAPLVCDLYRVEGTTRREALVTEAVASDTDESLVRTATQFSGDAGPYLSRNRSLVTLSGYGSLLVPNNPGVKLVPGSWRLRIKDINQFGRKSEVNVRVIFKRSLARGRPESARPILPLHLILTGTRGWTASTCKSAKDFQEAVSTLETIFAAAGIEARVSSVSDLPTQDGRIITINSGNDLLRLSSMGAATSGIKVFILNGEGRSIGGISSGIGGPVLAKKYKMGGIAVLTNESEPAPMMASSLAHELGHYLGLYHAKEDGTVLQDQIPDTVISDSGPTNLMYPQRNNDPTITRFFSQQQAEVMLGHPSVVPLLRR